MPFPDPVVVDRLKADWTDRFIRIRPGVRPELTRFEGKIGRVVTVNRAGRAVVDFADGAWYDVSDFLAVFEPVTDTEEIKTFDRTANSAQAFPSRQT